MQASDTVIIKGVREGLLIILDDDVPFSQVLTQMVERINAQPGFFKGAGVTLNTGRRIFDGPDFDVLYRMLTRNGMRVQAVVSLSAQSRMVAENQGVASRPPSFAAGDAGASLGLKGRGSGLTWMEPGDQGMEEAAPGLFLRCNLKPGQSVRYGGDVCILGDVEVGAEVVAEGDVVVWGNLRVWSTRASAATMKRSFVLFTSTPPSLASRAFSPAFQSITTLAISKLPIRRSLLASKQAKSS